MVTKQPVKGSSTKKTATLAIDRGKVHDALRGLSGESARGMLDEAIDLLPPAKFRELITRYLDVKQLRPDAPGDKNLGAQVRAFCTASRAGKYYESFGVNSKNFMQQSEGTRTFIADFDRLLDRCVTRASKGDAAEIREAIELMLGLLRHIDEGEDDVIFFADEGGSWQVGVDWPKVMPALFLCLARTTEPAEYARRVVEVVDEFDKHHRATHLTVAGRLVTDAQRKALRARIAATKSS